MDSVLESVARQWIAEDQLRNVLEGGEWVDMLDSDGKKLEGIRGKNGVSSKKLDGTMFGADLIEMQPGSKFELHVHSGDHILYIQSGVGAVHINGVNHSVTKGDLIGIPGELPHGVVGPPLVATEPLVIIAIGHPHKHVGASDRMQHPHDH
jgi:mannose-6-phosphate isomerase-like protein (cupin superfamily)